MHCTTPWNFYSGSFLFAPFVVSRKPCSYTWNRTASGLYAASSSHWLQQPRPLHRFFISNGQPCTLKPLPVFGPYPRGTTVSITSRGGHWSTLASWNHISIAFSGLSEMMWKLSIISASRKDLCPVFIQFSVFSLDLSLKHGISVWIRRPFSESSHHCWLFYSVPPVDSSVIPSHLKRICPPPLVEVICLISQKVQGDVDAILYTPKCNLQIHRTRTLPVHSDVQYSPNSNCI